MWRRTRHSGHPGAGAHHPGEPRRGRSGGGYSQGFPDPDRGRRAGRDRVCRRFGGRRFAARAPTPRFVRIKLDENPPAALAKILAAAGHDVDTSPDEGLTGRPDPAVWRAAQDTGRFLVTQDLDFSDVRRYQPGTHHGLLLVRLVEPSRRRLIERVRHLFATEAVDTWRRCFVVATDRKTRIRRPAA